MKPVFLLVDESRDLNFNGILNIEREFYEMSIYKKEYTEEELS